MSTASAMATLAIFAGVLLYARRASSATLPALPEPDPLFPLDDQDTLPEPELEIVDINRNLRAFLYAIRSSEHTVSDVVSGLDYFTFYGGGRFSGYGDHPVATGERAGVRLPDSFCYAAGYAPGCVSTAAGAYQFNLPTWNEIRSYAGPRLPDFSPASQDEAARRLLQKIGALPFIEAGLWGRAIEIAANRWASLPGSTADQGGRSMDYVLNRITDGLHLG